MNDIYHEKQSKELCALHALNNIFQTKDAFSQVGFILKSRINRDEDPVCLAKFRIQGSVPRTIGDI